MLRALVEQHAVCECQVAKIDDDLSWGLSIRLGSSGAHLGAIRSRVETLRARLTAVVRFAGSTELRGFNMELLPALPAYQLPSAYPQ